MSHPPAQHWQEQFTPLAAHRGTNSSVRRAVGLLISRFSARVAVRAYGRIAVAAGGGEVGRAYLSLDPNDGTPSLNPLLALADRRP